MIRVGTFASGIGAPEVAMRELSGWHPVFFSEIEPFPCAVLAHHWPDVPNLGDMTAVDGSEWRGKVDVVVAGTPCQAFSIAGLRKGLDDERGNLTLKLVELVNAIEPACLLWENVPGVLSDKGNAFGCFLAGLAGEVEPLVAPGGKWTNAGFVLGPKRSIAWRVLDAQYFGVAQRRRRVFLVASPRNGADPRAILFESEGVRRDTPPSRSTGQGVAGTLEASLGRSRGAGTPAGALTHDVAPCLAASGRGFERAGETRGQDPVVACLNGISNYGADVPTLRSKGGDAAGGSEALVAQPVAFDGYDHTTDNDCFATLSTKADHNRQLVFLAGPVPCAGGSKALAAHTWPAEVAPTLNAAFGAKQGLEDQHALGGAGLFVPCTQYGELAGTLTARHDSSPCADRGMNVVAIHGSQDPDVSGDVTHPVGRNQGLETCVARETCPTIKRDYGKGYGDGEMDGGGLAICQGAPMSVRRLTPREFSRLQGFPDDHLEIAYANADEAHSAQILHHLWRETGAPYIEKQEWRTGISAALLTPEILLAGVYGGWISWTLSARCASARGALSGENFDAEGFVQELRRNEKLRRPPYQRESFRQLAEKLDRSLSELPLESAQIKAFLRSRRLWAEAQRTWPLRYALATPTQVEKGRINPDGPRYKALGNSMAVPCVAWILKRIDKEIGCDPSTLSEACRREDVQSA